VEKTYGNFVDIEWASEYLVLSFSSNIAPKKELWSGNSLSADFLANYWGAILPRTDKAQQKEVKDAISFIVNELLENSLKNNFRQDGLINLTLNLVENQLRFYVVNTVSVEGSEKFLNFINRVLTEDLNDMYISQIEKNASDENSTESGLGLLTLLMDYNADLAWRFEPKSDAKGNFTKVTTLVNIEIIRK
jgi:hypothetical protein